MMKLTQSQRERIADELLERMTNLIEREGISGANGIDGEHAFNRESVIIVELMMEVAEIE